MSSATKETHRNASAGQKNEKTEDGEAKDESADAPAATAAEKKEQEESKEETKLESKHETKEKPGKTPSNGLIKAEFGGEFMTLTSVGDEVREEKESRSKMETAEGKDKAEAAEVKKGVYRRSEVSMAAYHWTKKNHKV